MKLSFFPKFCCTHSKSNFAFPDDFNPTDEAFFTFKFTIVIGSNREKASALIDLIMELPCTHREQRVVYRSYIEIVKVIILKGTFPRLKWHLVQLYASHTISIILVIIIGIIHFT